LHIAVVGDVGGDGFPAEGEDLAARGQEGLADDGQLVFGLQVLVGGIELGQVPAAD
jgi:hypothetical protein